MDKRKVFNELTTKNWTVLNSIGLGLIGFSVLMILEHYFKWGPIDLTDMPLGHEFIALISFLIGFILISKQTNNKFKTVLQKIINKKK